MLVLTGGNRHAWEPSSDADLTRGGVSRPRGCFAALPWWAVGAAAALIVSGACIRLEVSLCFAFFAGFKRDSPGCLGDPDGCPRHQFCKSMYKI
jgi:hypothetical protein